MSFLFKKIYNYIKRMKELEKCNDKLYRENLSCRYFVSCYYTNFEGARGAMQSILTSQTLEEARYYANVGLIYMDMRADDISKAKEFLIKEYVASLKNNEAKTLSWLEFQGCKKENEQLKQENEELKQEVKNFRDMAKKGLDEFKDVGGCWGCGLQLQLNQDIQDIKQLKAECEELKEKIETYNCSANCYKYKEAEKYKQVLEKIKEIIVECNNCCVEPPAMKFKCPECKEEMIKKIQSIVYEVLNER